MKKLALTLFSILAVLFAVCQPGELDHTFRPVSGVWGGAGEIQAIAVQPDGKIIIGGLFGHYDNTDVANIARINSDGSFDSTFQLFNNINRAYPF